MRRGGQVPTFETVGSYAYSNYEDAVEMFEAYGRRYYDSQKYEMRLFYARNEDGTYAANSIAISIPRQNGKSFSARDYSLDSACMGEDADVPTGKRVLYSAHRGKTVRDMFKEMDKFIENHEDFASELDDIYRAAGSEGLYFKNGGCIEFQTRTNSGGRGGTYDVVIIDEAQELTEAQQEALLPVVSAAQEIGEGAGTQVIYLGTPPGKECAGTVFRGMHDRAHAGDSGLWWVEWGVQGDSIEDIDIDDKDTWYACNPAMGRRMSEAAVKNERDTMSREGFARERLGWWEPGKANAVIPKARWDACATEEPPEDGVKCFAVKFSPSGDVVSVCVALKPRDGSKPHFELVHYRDTDDGAGWLAPWLAARKGSTAQYIVDGLGSAENLQTAMERAGVRKSLIKIPKSSEVAAANDALLDAIRSESVTFFRDEYMDLAAEGCSKRKIGTNGGWGFRSEGDAEASILEAAALALWGANMTRRDPNRKARIAW